MKESRAFTLAAQAAGLSLRGISVGAVEVLLRMLAKPLPYVKSDRAVRSTSDAGNKLGPLIRHGLAAFNGEAYVISDKGRDYLAKLEAAGLLGKEES